MQRTTIDFGIDLGTTNSTIAVIDDIDAKVIPNKGGSGITPSAVWIDKRGNIHVGQESKLHALTDDPDNADLEFKLRMGSGADGKKTFVRSGREMTPEELSAEVLKSLKMDAQSNMGEVVRAAVITVPAAFENSQTSATKAAANLAGFSLCPLLLEPVAASLAYGFQSEADNVYWFVYDFGGGTFDAALMRIRDGLIQVVNHDGDNFLGGKLLDWDVVTKKMIPALTAQFDLPEFKRGNKRWEAALGKLKFHSEQAKVEVCRTRAPFEIWVEGLCTDANGKDVDFAFTLTPADVEEVTRPYIERSLGLCKKTLSRAGLSGSSMEKILMVGGSTLNPWIREAVQAELGAKVEYGIDPVTVVARGAAIFASTQSLPSANNGATTATCWRIEIEHKPVGNIADPDIGGRVIPPDGLNLAGYTMEFVDLKTQWRSGRVTLAEDGVFLTQLYAEKQRRHEFSIELCDRTGTRIVTSPDRVSYTLGVVPEENPPAAWTIGVGMADGSVQHYVAKGTRLPARKLLDFFSTVNLHAGNAEDVLRIPLLEGEHLRAERNHHIGTMVIKGSDIKRDLPMGSTLEITVFQDKSQQLRVQAYIPTHDEDFQVEFNPEQQHESVEELRKEAARQKERLAKLREKAAKTSALKAQAAIGRIEDEELVDQVDSLAEAAETEREAVTNLDRRVQAFASALDEVEEAVEWPELLEKAEEARASTQRIVDEHGTATHRSQSRVINEQLQRAIDSGDADLLKQATSALEILMFDVLDSQPAFHVARFNWLLERMPDMRDKAQAEQIAAQGRRAINNNDVPALKAANRQLISLLPVEKQNEAQAGVNRGDIMRGSH